MRMLRPRRFLFALTGALLVLGVSLWAVDGPLTNALNLRVRTDGNGYLVSTGGAYSGVDGPLTNFGNLRLRTDGNGYLMVTLAAASSVTVNGIATTSTDGLALLNTTASTVGVPVQYSPRSRWCGTAWKTDATTASQIDCLAFEVRPVSAAGATTFSSAWMGSINGGAYSDLLTLSSAGSVNIGLDLTMGRNISVANAGQVYWATRAVLQSTADALIDFTNNAGTLLARKNMTAVAESVTFRSVGAAETIAGNASNFRITVGGTPGTTATVTFGTAWTTAPVCVAQNEVTANILKAAAAVGQVVLTGIVVAADTIVVHCEGY